MPNTSATLKPGGCSVVPQGTQLTLTRGPFKVADPPDSSDTATGWLREGETCSVIAQAGRLAFLVDAAAYFSALKAAAQRARHSIFIIGWDVHSRTLLDLPDKADPALPNELGPFLDYLVRRQRGLHVRVLDWDSPLVYGLDREWLPQMRFNWFTHPRLCFALDACHPVGAAHHQKLVVIDDALAFIGGLDLARGRLDTCEHLPDDPCRTNADGVVYGPFHDIQAAVDGAAARALAKEARARWARATGERVQPVKQTADVWPDGVEPDLTDTPLGIARTYGAWRQHPAVHEIEALLLAAIAQARRSIYIENQYFAAKRLALALAERLRQPDSPHVTLILPQEPTGWLEQAVMGITQRCLLAQLREADLHGRLGVYIPMHGDVAITVHAKLMIVDDRLLTVGSANLNNRSMGLDSECNIALDAGERPAATQAITRLRQRLLAEHLGTTPARVAEYSGPGEGSNAAIEALNGQARHLSPFPHQAPDSMDTVIADTRLLDPAAPAVPERLTDEMIGGEHHRRSLRRTLLGLGAMLAGLLALAALWRWGPLQEWLDVERLQHWLAQLRGDRTATAALLAVYVVSGLLMFPVTVMIAVTGALYGPLSGLAVAGSGTLLSAVVGYGAGALLGRGVVQRLAGHLPDSIGRQLARRGVLSVTLIRLLPLAPFTVVNLAAGASHIRFRDFVLGTALGMAPGIVAITVFSGQIAALVHRPSATNLAILIVVLAAISVFALWAWRRFAR